MDRDTPRSIPRQQFKWNSPPTTRSSAGVSHIDENIIDRSRLVEDESPVSLLEMFLGIPDCSPRLEYELPVFERLLDTDLLENTKAGRFEVPHQLAAWLFDMSHDNEPRSYNGSLSILDLYQISTIKRIDEEGMPDAITRRLYMPNPWPSTLGLLLLKAGEYQAPAVRRLMFKHLNMATTVGLETTEMGEFVLEFHMPCYVWRTNSGLRKDIRPTADKTPLRKSMNVSFMDRFKTANLSSDSVDSLYECQTSICVTGRNITQGWTAFCLVDSFFDDDTDPNNENMLPYYQNADGSDSDLECYNFDAISLGHVIADKRSVKDPRGYFMQVLRWRTKRIKEEWLNIGCQMTRRVHGYLYDPRALPLTREDSNLATVKGESQKIEINEAWVRQTSEVLTRQIILLSKTVQAWHRFVTQDKDRINHQADQQTSARILESFSIITDNIVEMEETLRELRYLEIVIENFKKQLELHVAVDGSRAIILQHWNVTILQFFSPMALAGSIMQAGLVFGHTVVCFTFLTGVLTLIMWNMKWFYEIVLSLRWPETLSHDKIETLHVHPQAAFMTPAFPAPVHQSRQSLGHFSSKRRPETSATMLMDDIEQSSLRRWC